MSHDLMAEGKSLYLYKEPGWHNLGIVSPNPMGAEEALRNIEGVYYEKRPIFVELNGLKQEIGDYAIVRSPIPSDPVEKVSGFVKKGYTILQPIDACKSFDENVCEAVETLGFLGQNGEKMFLTWILPSIDVNGDEIKLYGFVAIGFDGKFGVSLYVVSVRVVCSNTFTMAVYEATNKNDARTGQIWSGRHNSINLNRDLGIWMKHVQSQALGQSQMASNIFNEMAKKAIQEKEVVYDLLFQVYPNPKPLPENYPEALRNEKQEVIDFAIEKAERDRDAVFNLYNGQGIAITADAFGLFSAVTEYENHERMTKKPADYSILFGNRANTMNRAYQVLTNYSKVMA